MFFTFFISSILSVFYLKSNKTSQKARSGKLVSTIFDEIRIFRPVIFFFGAGK